MAESVGPALLAERDERLQRWRRDIDIITHYVWDLDHHRALWREMRDALIAASPEDSTFLDHNARLYTERQLIALRRLVDLDPRSISMARLLTELGPGGGCSHRNLMTRTLVPLVPHGQTPGP